MEAIRLAKRLAEQAGCSRAQAERYIAGGWVAVDGSVVEEPATRVTAAQQVVLLPGASAQEPPPVTILLHKPAGLRDALACVTAQTLEQHGAARERFLKRHLARQTITLPLETGGSGLLVYTQDFRVARKLVEEGARVEQEYVVQVSGQLHEGGLDLLRHEPMKVSWQSENRLRFAAKGVQPGQIGRMCEAVGLQVVAIKRIRIGRVPLASLPEGRWRYLGEYERF
jgi:23S rRNA pseudouridine2604 synthase